MFELNKMDMEIVSSIMNTFIRQKVTERLKTNETK